MLTSIKKNMSLVLVTALILTGCGQQSDARSDGQNSGTYKLPDPITVVKDEETPKAASFEEKKPEKATLGEAAESNKAEAWDGKTMENTFKGDGFDVVFKLQNTWEGGFTANVEIKNTGAKKIRNWEVDFNLPCGIRQLWNAQLSGTDSSGYTVKATEDWNRDIEVGKSVEFGFNGQKNFDGFPASYKLTGELVEADASPAPAATQDPNAADPNATTDPEATDETEDTDDIEDAEITAGNQFKKHGRLKVKGRYIVDEKGKAFKLKGISTHGIAWFPQYVNKSAFKSFKKWGANAVRLACYTSQGEQYNPSKDWKTIDKGVKAATELGMYVIIDWHILQENNPTMTTSRAKKFFKHFAQKYGKRKNVIFEICNEPNGCDWKDVKKYAKKVIPVIRKYSNNIIVCGTPTWSQDVDTAANSRLTGKYAKNLCYTIHFYAATHKDNIRDKVKYAFKKKLPILCTEFSICDASGNGALDKGSANTWIKLFKKYKIGFFTWSLCNKAESSALIKSSCNKTGNFKKSDLTAAGKWFISKLR